MQLLKILAGLSLLGTSQGFVPATSVLLKNPVISTVNTLSLPRYSAANGAKAGRSVLYSSIASGERFALNFLLFPVVNMCTSASYASTSTLAACTCNAMDLKSVTHSFHFYDIVMG